MSTFVQRTSTLLSRYARTPDAGAGTELNGSVDIIANDKVAGWTWDNRDPTRRLQVSIRQAGEELAEATACIHRSDLEIAGIGDGCYSFDVQIKPAMSDHALASVTVKIKDTNYFLPIFPSAIRPARNDCQLNVYTFRKLLDKPPSTFNAIRFDPNNDCNLRCVYCHNHRSPDVIDKGEFDAFIRKNVISVNYFQIGCIMEPTLDSRLCELMLMVADSPAKPKADFVLQTNGILLHRHDYGKIKDSGLSQLQVSLDTADPGTQRSLRSGMSLQRVLRNVASFRKGCPEISVTFVATVTRENVASMDSLVQLGLDTGVGNFVFREVFYHPENDVVDHVRMPSLLLRQGDFSTMKQRLLTEFGAKASLIFADQEFLTSSEKKMIADSLRSQ